MASSSTASNRQYKLHILRIACAFVLVALACALFAFAPQAAFADEAHLATNELGTPASNDPAAQAPIAPAAASASDYAAPTTTNAAALTSSPDRVPVAAPELEASSPDAASGSAPLDPAATNADPTDITLAPATAPAANSTAPADIPLSAAAAAAAAVNGTFPDDLQFAPSDTGFAKYLSASQNAIYYTYSYRPDDYPYTTWLRLIKVSLDDLSVTTLLDYAHVSKAFMANEKLYLDYSEYRSGKYTSTCEVFDLATATKTLSFTVENFSAAGIGADQQGRIYIGGYEGEDDTCIKLFTAAGTLLSTASTTDYITRFDAFDATSGYFAYEAYYNWRYWGYDHDGKGVYLGRLQNSNLIQAPVTSIESADFMNPAIGLIEYVSQDYYLSHSIGAELVGGKYLATSSVTFSELLVFDMSTMETVFTMERDNVNNDLNGSSYKNETSVGTRCVYIASRNAFAVFNGEDRVIEIDATTKKITRSYQLKNYLFDLFANGNTLYAVEMDADKKISIQKINANLPTKISVTPQSATMKVAQAQMLSFSSNTDSIPQVEWSSSNPAVATVTPQGRVVAWSAGTTTITCKETSSGLTATAAITVSAPAALPSTVSVAPVASADRNTTQSTYHGNYSDIDSCYLHELTGGVIERVEFVKDKGVLIERYNASRQLVSSKTIPFELPRIGGFFSGTDANFLVVGEANTNESDEFEVVRVIKYSKDWQRLGATTIKGANTYVPFDAGSCRMDETAGKLYIHTCHTMYTTPDDGLHHQANMTFVINGSTMELVDHYYDILNISQAGYVSHSFDQYVRTDGTYVYRVDLGDAGPRAVAITRCDVDGSITSVAWTSLLAIQGSTGQNYTGVTLGGLELSSDNCLVVGLTVDQSSKDAWWDSNKRNVFLAVVKKNLSGPSVTMLTELPEDSSISICGTPKLVKLASDSFLVMWEEYDESTGTYTTKVLPVDGGGSIAQKAKTINVRLGLCRPILLSNGYVSWYVTDDSGHGNIYALNPQTLSIQQTSLANATIAAIPVQTCNNEAITPELTVTLGSTQLVPGLDYQVSYTNNINAGTATATITGLGAYSGSKSANFQIKGRSISEAAIYFTDYLSHYYDGKAQTQGIEVYLYGYGDLVEGKDYTVSYKDNINVGTATIVVNGTGNFSGTATETFSIYPMYISEYESRFTIDPIPDQIYRGKPVTPAVTVRFDGVPLKEGVDYELEYCNNDYISSYGPFVWVDFMGNFYGALSQDFVIKTDPDAALPSTPDEAPVLDGHWASDANGWYFVNDASSYEQTGQEYPTNGWAYINGETYHFNSKGYLETGWIKDGNDYYFADANGAMQTGWVPSGGSWYFMKLDGKMATGMTDVGGARYYMKSSGAMHTGWLQQGSDWYYFNGSGAMHKGWLNAGAWYYMNSDGKMATGWVNDGGTRYYMHESGAMATGWVKDNGTWYYMYGSGAMAKGWVNSGGTWYYMNADGKMATGWVADGSTWYYMNPSGAMATGWVSDGGAWYYMWGSGAMAANTWVGNYYLTGSGAMATNQWIGQYYVGPDGAWIPNYQG